DDLLAFAYGLEEELDTIRAVRDALPSAAPMVVRLHPNHDPARYRAALPLGIELTSGREQPLASDLERSRLVVGKASTALIEAAASGVPSLALNFGPTPDIWGMSQCGLP